MNLGRYLKVLVFNIIRDQTEEKYVGIIVVILNTS